MDMREDVTWTFDNDSVLINNKGQPIPVRPAGHVRVNLGSDQYNVSHNAKDKK